jgi:peptidoglycan hydrolase FlgJ
MALALSTPTASVAPPVGALAAATLPPGVADKARGAAQDFEAVYLNTMFAQMFTGLDGDGPLGAGTGAGAGVWRSFLTDEYARTVAKSGGIGIADQVYRELIAQQETRAK